MIEVSGVLISCDTLVIRSVFSRSFLTLFATASSSPSPIELISPAISLCSLVNLSRDMTYPISPWEIIRIPFLSLSLPIALYTRKINVDASTSRRIPDRKELNPAKLPAITIQCTNVYAPNKKTVFHTLPRLTNISLRNTKNILRILFFHTLPAFILLTRLRNPIRNTPSVYTTRADIPTIYTDACAFSAADAWDTTLSINLENI